MSVCVSLEGLVVRYRGAEKDALALPSIRIQAGEAVALLGHNGSGKSTLLDAIAGVRKPTKGRVEVLGQPPRPGADVCGSIGYLASTDRFIESLSIAENIEYRLVTQGRTLREARSTAASVISKHRLTKLCARKPAALSSGQRQRALLAAALSHEPPLILLDEPTSALDLFARRDVHTTLSGLRDAKNTTLLVATHDLNEAQALCSRAIVLMDGSVDYDGPIDGVLETVSSALDTASVA